MKDRQKPAGDPSLTRINTTEAKQVGDWTAALEAYSQRLTLNNLTATDKVEFHEGRAACYRVLGEHFAEAEGSRLANLLCERKQADWSKKPGNAELSVINSVRRGLHQIWISTASLTPPEKNCASLMVELNEFTHTD